MLEQKHHQIVPTKVFIKRMVGYFGISILLISSVLFIGVAGYHWLADLDWVDSLLNASMILGGMGPVDTLTKTSAKVFASGYALFSGLVFIGVMGIMLVPVMHRILHKFHMDSDDAKK